VEITLNFKIDFMNQTEIFQNMTKGEWKIMPMQGVEINSTESRDSFIHCNDLSKDYHGVSVGDKANTELIIMMHRNTIGKGINPESVEKMYNALKSIVEGEYKNPDSHKMIAKEVLNAAKL